MVKWLNGKLNSKKHYCVITRMSIDTCTVTVRVIIGIVYRKQFQTPPSPPSPALELATGSRHPHNEQ